MISPPTFLYPPDLPLASVVGPAKSFAKPFYRPLSNPDGSLGSSLNMDGAGLDDRYR